MIQWIALAAPIAAAACGWAYLNVIRNFVTYETIHVQFGGDSERYTPNDKPIGLIAFERIILVNKSIKPLQSVRVPIDHVTDILFGRLNGSSIGPIDPPTEVASKPLVICIPEMPAKEKVTIAFLHRGTGHLWGRSLQGGGNKYRLVPLDDYLSTVRKLQIGVVIILLVVVNVWA